MLGPAALGGLKAAQGLVSGPTSVVINAGGSFGLPEATRQFAERGWKGMVRISRFVTGAGFTVAAACAIAILLAAPALLRILYGPEFVSYAPSARIFALTVVVSSCGVGPVLTLTTTRRVRPLFIVQIARLVASVALTCVFAAAWGVTGVATANLATCAVSVAATLVIQSRVRRSVERTQSPSEELLKAEEDDLKEFLDGDEDEVKTLLDALEGELKKLLDSVEEG
jgi:O-antigen/teichoic acid export membrane protein